MILNVKKLSLWGFDIVIRARAKTPHVVFDNLENEACFYYVLEGNSELYMPLQKVKILEKQGVSLQCGNYIGKFFSNEEIPEAEILIVKFSKEILQKIYINDFPSLFEKIKKNRIQHYGIANNSSLLMDYVKGLLFYIDNPHLAIEELLVLKIRELFILLANTDESDTIQQLIENLFCDVDFNFRQLIEQNYYSNLKLEELAHLCMMSLSSFKRKFKKEFGESPHKFLQQKKLEQSLDLIKNTSLSLSEISFKCGFKEYANFSIAFKKAHGISPRDFR